MLSTTIALLAACSGLLALTQLRTRNLQLDALLLLESEAETLRRGHAYDTSGWQERARTRHALLGHIHQKRRTLALDYQLGADELQRLLQARSPH